MTSQPPPPSTANIGMLTSECCVLWPSTPVWVVLSGGHYTTLFALDPAIAAPGALDELTAASDADLAFYHANGLSRIRWSAVPAAGGADPIDVQGARLASVGVFVDLQFAYVSACGCGCVRLGKSARARVYLSVLLVVVGSGC